MPYRGCLVTRCWVKTKLLQSYLPMQVSVEKHQSTRKSQHRSWGYEKKKEEKSEDDTHLSDVSTCCCVFKHDRGSPEEENESGLHCWKRQAKCCSTRSLSWVSPISTTTFRKDLSERRKKTFTIMFYEQCNQSSASAILTSGHDREVARWSQRISDIPRRQHDCSRY